MYSQRQCVISFQKAYEPLWIDAWFDSEMAEPVW